MSASALAGRTVLLTGATGTVGSVVVRHLAEAGAKVRATVRGPGARLPAGVEAAVAELVDAPALERAARGAEVVVSCAAALTDDPEECRRINVEGTRNLVDAVRRAGVRLLVHLSSVSAYQWSGRSEVNEDAPLLPGPVTDYGTSKAESERVVRAGEGGGLAAVILRPVAVLSMDPRSYWGPLALERARKRAGPVWGLRLMPYVHVENLARAVLLAATVPAAAGRAYDVVDGNGDAAEYLAAVARATGQPPPSLSSDHPAIRVGGERIRRELVYAPVDLWPRFLEALAAYRAR